jgi:hypothetical protein
MVNFRFHLVSLTAVFLALAAGIVIGAGVVDRQTVALLENRLSDVEANSNKTKRDNDELKAQLTLWSRFSSEVGDRMVEGRLPTTRVLVAGVDGTPREPVQRLQETLRASGATLEGTVWFLGAWRLDKPEQVRALAVILDLPDTTRPADLRVAGLARVAEAWGGGGSEALARLQAAGFVDFQAEPGRPATVDAVPAGGSVIVLADAEQGGVPAADLAVPFAAQLVDRGLSLLAAQPVPAVRKPDERARPAPFVEALRATDAAGRLSTVDDVDDYRGRVAAVLAIADLRGGRFGHYGISASAQRLLPQAAE